SPKPVTSWRQPDDRPAVLGDLRARPRLRLRARHMDGRDRADAPTAPGGPPAPVGHPRPPRHERRCPMSFSPQAAEAVITEWHDNRWPDKDDRVVAAKLAEETGEV